MDVERLVSKVGETLSVGRAFGAAYEKDGAMVIPVALVAGGGGGGEGTDGQSPSPGAAASESVTTSARPASGSGGGFGGVVLPMGAYVVKDGVVRWVPAVNVNLIVLASLALLRLVVRGRRRSHRRR